MSTAPLVHAPPPAARRPRVSLWLLRGLLTAQLATAVLQPLLAGLFLSGDVDAVVWHGVVGSVLVVLGIGVAAVSVLFVASGSGRWWVLPVAVVAAFLQVVQLGLGFAGLVQAHVPLGVTVVAGVVVLTGWAWSPAARRSR